MGSSTTSPGKVPALKFTLGGAPATWHSIGGLLGFYHPDHPTPVGGPGECPLDIAKDAAKAPGSPVELVHITEAQAGTVRKLIQDEIHAVQRALREDDGATRQQIDATNEALGTTEQEN